MKIKEENTIGIELINLYKECFKEDVLYNNISREFIENDLIINKAFNIYKQYGTIIKGFKNNKLISFLIALHINELFKDKESVSFLFSQYKDIYNFIKSKGINGDYIILLGVDKEYRNMGYATKLVNYYINNKNNTLIADVDDPFSYKIFKKLSFKEIKLNDNYYIVYKENQQQINI